MRKFIIVLLALFLIGLAAFCGFILYGEFHSKDFTAAGGAPGGDGISGSADRVREGEEEPFMDFPDIGERVQVFPRLSGLEVLKISVRRGETVRGGQVLAELDDAPLQEKLRQLQEDVRRAEEDYRRAVKSGDLERESFGALLDEARGSLASAESKAGYRYVIAPVGGVLVERGVQRGDESRADVPMFVIGLPAAPASGDRE